MTSPKKEVLKSKICCACKKEKEIKNFYVNSYMSSGYEARCKMCKKSKQRCRGEKSYKRSKNFSSGRPRSEDPQLWNVRKQDWINTYEFLKKIGYDLSNEKTIHEQFCEKHNLKPRKRPYDRSIQYSPKDLGLS